MLFNVFKSTSSLLQEIICSTAKTLRAQHVMQMEPGLEPGFFSCCYFPVWWETPPEEVLMAVRRRDTNLCCNFLKPEFAGARHWKILSSWSWVGLLNSPRNLSASPSPVPHWQNSVVFLGSLRSSLWLHSWIIPSQPCHCSYVYSPKALRLSTQDCVLQIKSYYRSEISVFGERNKRYVYVSSEVKLFIL